MLNSSEFMPYVVFIASPTVDELTQRQNEAPPNARRLTVSKSLSSFKQNGRKGTISLKETPLLHETRTK